MQIPIRVAELISSAFLDAKILRLYTDENHSNVHNERCLKIYLSSLSGFELSVYLPLEICQVSDAWSAAASKIQLDYSSCSLFGDV